MDSELVRRVAAVARIKLTEEEVEEFSSDLEEILDYFSILDEAPSIPEFSFNPVPVVDISREDTVSFEIDPSVLREIMDTYQSWVRGPRLS